MGLIDSKVILFNDGEAITFDDMNKLPLGSTQRAWELPGYADALAHAPVVGTGAPADYDSLFAGATDMATMVFSKGGGGQVEGGGATWSVGAGFLGIYAAAAPPVALSPKMQWVYLDAPVTFSPALAPGGQKRYDVLSLAITESSSDAESRDFKDGTTGALSTSSLSKRTKLAGALTITTGTPGATPTPPAAPGHVVAMVRVNSTTGVEAFWDCTQPFGPACSVLSVPAIHGNWSPVSTTWARGLGIIYSNAVPVGGVYCFPPNFCGDGSAKLIGLSIEYSMSTGGTIKLVTFGSIAGDGADIAATIDLTSFCATGLQKKVDIDLRGYPKFVSATRGPIWGTGLTYRTHGDGRSSGFGGLGVAVEFTGGSGSAVDVLYWVKWYFAKG